MDKMGPRVGVGRGQWVVMPAEDDDLDRVSDIIGGLGEQEQCTIVESVSATGAVASHTERQSDPEDVVCRGGRWFAEVDGGLKDFVVGTSESGHSNDVLFFQWLQHWEYISRPNRSGARRLLPLDGYGSNLTWL